MFMWGVPCLLLSSHDILRQSMLHDAIPNAPLVISVRRRDFAFCVAFIDILSCRDVAPVWLAQIHCAHIESIAWQEWSADGLRSLNISEVASVVRCVHVDSV